MSRGFVVSSDWSCPLALTRPRVALKRPGRISTFLPDMSMVKINLQLEGEGIDW
ncbi:hypothetical protein HMPREF9004_0119 [Schaalia cardiffensis F0333]|uniref:Uncharacterized protein n=1 Tax=Schaalia cardiffensis F0333 TaxID=888050 RepID=N6W9G7_9ACTO|nr:hypothetical protein HMPREF9004_0119 [Schaalia cardiffensis F0333]